MDAVYFVLLIGVLIFVHELGHFAVAKAFGVRVLVFSIGFGPRVLRVRLGETEYCLGLLPFGGFVTLLEEARSGGPIDERQRARTLEALPAYKRALIVLAGPAMNMVFPVIVTSSVYFDDTELLPPIVGAVSVGKPADGRLQPGDRILEVEGTATRSFPEVQRIVGERAGKLTRLVVEREGRAENVTLTPEDTTEGDDAEELLGTQRHVGRMGVHPSFPAAVIGVPRTDSPAYRAGLRTFDRVTAVNGRPIERTVDLVRALSQSRGDSLVVAYLRPVAQPRSMDGLCDMAVAEPGVATLTPRAPGSGPPAADHESRTADVLARTGIESSDLYAAYVPEGSSEWKAGLRAGDRVTTLDGAVKRSWSDLADDLKRGAGRTRALAWTRDGEPMAGSFSLREEEWDDEFGQRYHRYVFRTTHALPLAPDALVHNPSRLSYAITRGVEETWRTTRTIGLGLVRLAEGRLSFRAMSGPITLYDVAGEAAARGASHFAWAMALVSVNLGLLNLLPIPVLDGGQLALLVLEAIRRKPISRRSREIASLVGMSILVVMMLVAFKNDVDRHWGAILGGTRELFRS